MSKPPKTVERIRSTGALGQFPGAVLASVEHDVYVLEAEAATALSEAQAEIARLEDQVGDWIGRADEANVRADRLEAALRPFAQEHAWGPDDRFEIVLAGQYGSITGSDLDRARAALAQGKGEGV